MAGRFAIPRESEYGSNGEPLSGAKLFFYVTGTTAPNDTFSDDGLTVANTNPVVADAAGRFGDIFLKNEDYKVVLTDSADVVIYTADPVRAPVAANTAVRSVSTTASLTSGDDGRLIKADATAGAFTVSLPPVSTAGNGFDVIVTKIDNSVNVVTVDADGAETINGSSDFALTAQNNSVRLRSDGAGWIAYVVPQTADSTPLPRGYIDGLGLANDVTDAEHDIEVSAGAARSDDDKVNILLSSALIKRIDAAWAVGAGNGGMDTGAVAIDTWYYLWLIRRSDTGTVDALFSASSTAPTMPANYDVKRRIGAVLTDASANILAFKQFGDKFWWADPPFDVNVTDQSTTAVDRTLSVPPGITGVCANVNVIIAHASAARYVYIRAPGVQNDEPVNVSDGPLSQINSGAGGLQSSGNIAVQPVNDSGQISTIASGTATNVRIATLGWQDPR